MKEREIKRGQIYMVELNFTTNSIMRGTRPCIIVSNNKNNKYSPVVHVVPMTSTAKKKKIPTHYDMDIHNQIGTALCESVMPVAKEQIGAYICTVRPKDMYQINRRLKMQLALRDSDSYEYEGINYVNF